MKKFVQLRRIVSAVVNTPLGLFGYELRTIPITATDNYLWLKNSGICTVIDVGANVGQFAKTILKALPQANVYSFEPLSHCCEELNRLCRDYENWKVFPFACGEKAEQVKMYRSEFSPSSSLLKMADKHKELFPQTANISSETVSVRPLDDVVGPLDLEKEVLVKMDVQGFEDRVIRGGHKTFKLAKIVITEVSFEKLYEAQGDFHTVYGLLYQLGFHFCGFVSQMCESQTGLPIQADAIFMRQK